MSQLGVTLLQNIHNGKGSFVFESFKNAIKNRGIKKATDDITKIHKFAYCLHWIETGLLELSKSNANYILKNLLGVQANLPKKSQLTEDLIRELTFLADLSVDVSSAYSESKGPEASSHYTEQLEEREPKSDRLELVRKAVAQNIRRLEVLKEHSKRQPAAHA